ncbi:uncharacterized protein LOC129587269 isoform X2 [Paramacrobiotus metropolitanus]|uniref:uncharacterized protein LOC129587269 isoform X2 n=1 Tax=Paramacrobiotus metropolitanus TaxID=2943436 RepID=UPI0024460675|nr:uncharacterized protein LOC129587269 isoform X2 [Paramacrobiotus metropolitanus]
MESPASLPPFRRLLRGANSFSHQNTVAVRSLDGAWLLGYLQDLTSDENYAFIEFDSTKKSACWIRSCFIYPLPLILDNKPLTVWKNKPVWVALRDEMDGPFRFRPATLLECVKMCRFCYVSLEISDAADRTSSSLIEVVDRCQIVEQLPSDEMPIQDKSNLLTYRKYIIPISKTDRVLQEAADVYRIIALFRRSYQYDRWNPATSLSDGCRFHLAVGPESCTFLVITHSMDTITEHERTKFALHALLDKHFKARHRGLLVGCPNCPDNGGICGNVNEAAATFCESEVIIPETSICSVSHNILMEILANLDLQARMRIKRVCWLWHAISSAPGTLDEHVIISFKGCVSTNCLLDNCYNVALLLHRAVNSETKSLTITDLNFKEHTFFIPVWLGLTHLQLPLVVLKHGRFDFGGWVYDETSSLLKHGIMRLIEPFKDLCRTLILHNYTLSRLFCHPISNVLHEVEDLVPLPAAEKQLVIPLNVLMRDGQGSLFTLNTTEVTLRRVMLPCVDGWEAAMSHFMRAIDAAFPAAGADVYKKVQAIHARWLDTLSYPDEWQRIRHLLSVFSGFQSDGTPLHWDNVDLRQLEIGQLSTMALLAISEAFVQ